MVVEQESGHGTGNQSKQTGARTRGKHALNKRPMCLRDLLLKTRQYVPATLNIDHESRRIDYDMLGMFLFRDMYNFSLNLHFVDVLALRLGR